MIPTKLRTGQILIVFAIAGVWIATEWSAAELEFQARLGSPWFVAIGTPFYYPRRLFVPTDQRRPIPIIEQW